VKSVEFLEARLVGDEAQGRARPHHSAIVSQLDKQTSSAPQPQSSYADTVRGSAFLAPSEGSSVRAVGLTAGKASSVLPRREAALCG
jgi:hypothetical protein